MSVEIATKFRQIKTLFRERIGDIARGHTLQEEADVIRILADPPSISPEDVKKYMEQRFQSAAFSAGNPFGQNFDPTSIPRAVQAESERQKRLTPEQRIEEVRTDAEAKARAWGLKQNV